MTDREEMRGTRGGLPQADKKKLAGDFSSEGLPSESGFGHGQAYGAPREELKAAFTGLLHIPSERQDLQVQDTKKRLAKRANQIYRTLCDELALNECFFYGFRAWSEFVDGKISETKFYEAAKAEAEDVIARSR
jgi:hypothetical protein